MYKINQEIIDNYMVRKSAKQKEKFREYIVSSLKDEGFSVRVDKYNKMPYSKNIIVGNINKAKYIFTAHYDTPARFFLPNLCFPTNKILYLSYQLLLFLLILIIPVTVFILLKSMFVLALISSLLILAISAILFVVPSNKFNYNDNTSGIVTLIEILIKSKNLNDVCVVFFDQEELGLLGSMFFKNKYKSKLTDKTIINFDCVGDGDNLLFIYKDINDEIMNILKKEVNNKNIILKPSNKCIYPSDQTWFSKNIGVCACNKFKNKLYFSKIHTNKDKTLDYNNIDILSNIAIDILSND